MEDTKSLLMMVLHKIFENQPKTIENTFQLIHNFNNGKVEKKNYEKTLKTICDLMNDELPSPILVYVLTLVDMPQNFDATSPIIEKMRKTHDFLPEINARPHLLAFLNNVKPTNIMKSRIIEETESSEKCRNSTENPKANDKTFAKKSSTSFLKPVNVLKRTRRRFPKIIGSPKRLLDMCCTYVVANENVLKTMYKKKQILAWRSINSNEFSGNILKRCYDVVEDLNKKTKWLREIENESISPEFLMKEYKHDDFFLKENQMFHELQKDPFVLSEQCEKTIHALFNI